MKFLCDQMLGTLAKWLRIYGFDTFYASLSISDEELLKISKNEKRILITRDKELIYRCKREKINCIKIDSTDLDKQLSIVLNDLKIQKEKILSRCILCNSEISKISKTDIKNNIPTKVFQNHEKFWFCKKCDKIYWKGSHFENMLNKIEELQN
jgi:hypothetical protein